MQIIRERQTGFELFLSAGLWNVLLGNFQQYISVFPLGLSFFSFSFLKNINKSEKNPRITPIWKVTQNECRMFNIFCLTVPHVCSSSLPCPFYPPFSLCDLMSWSPRPFLGRCRAAAQAACALASDKFKAAKAGHNPFSTISNALRVGLWDLLPAGGHSISVHCICSIVLRQVPRGIGFMFCEGHLADVCSCSLCSCVLLIGNATCLFVQVCVTIIRLSLISLVLPSNLSNLSSFFLSWFRRVDHQPTMS